MKTQTARNSGFTLVEIMIVVAIIGLLAAIAVPNFVKARTTAQQKACMNNLQKIEGAKAQWALENKKVDTDTASTTDLQSYFKGNTFPSCPANGTYTLNTVGTATACSVSGHTL